MTASKSLYTVYFSSVETDGWSQKNQAYVSSPLKHSSSLAAAALLSVFKPTSNPINQSDCF